MEIYVYADWEGIGHRPSMLGTLTVLHTKGHHVISFEYDKDWFTGGFAFPLDPDLKLYPGPQYLPKEKINFGVFMDSSPDRWGKTLMDRREAIMAREKGRKPRKLFEEDYLLGVYDLHRMGGLRFRREGNENFENDNKGLAAPPFTSLRELQQASLALEKDMLSDAVAKKWINMLIAPGASLGGARPKAGVLDEKGALWIAKFPSAGDSYNVAAWEMIANELGMKLGINMAQGLLKQFGKQHHSYLSKRFDRTRGGARIHFASAMTLLGQSDGASNVSYLDMAEFIMRHGAVPDTDLEELWKRIVFYIAIKNTDDHLRNHGFLLTQNGWRLSPAYDVNPNYFGTGLAINISETDNNLHFELAREVAKYFRLSEKKAGEFIAETGKIIKGWKKLADKYKLSSQEKDRMAPAFEHFD